MKPICFGGYLTSFISSELPGVRPPPQYSRWCRRQVGVREEVKATVCLMIQDSARGGFQPIDSKQHVVAHSYMIAT